MQVIRPYVYYKPVRKVALTPSRQVHVFRTCKVKVTQIEVTSYYVGKSIILFTMFYCTLNWWHYKALRENVEKKDDKKK